MKYLSKDSCDRLVVNFPKGKRETYTSAAHEFGISFSGLIRLSVEEFIANHSDEESAKKVKASEKLSAQERKLLKAFDALPKESRAIVLKLVEDFSSKVSAVNSVD
ncbi:MAG: hypothetical protein IKP64_07530 [Selenomonadaceae bacterium]|nr:hypothetical protein [Selenomonadaceae bacterium]